MLNPDDGVGYLLQRLARFVHRPWLMLGIMVVSWIAFLYTGNPKAIKYGLLGAISCFFLMILIMVSFLEFSEAAPRWHRLPFLSVILFAGGSLLLTIWMFM